MADYPSSVFSARTGGANLSSNPHSDLHDDSEAEIEAIETELGTAPSGTYSTVKARLDALTPTPTIYAPTLTATTTPPTMGVDSRSDGSYMKQGRWVTGTVRFAFGSSGVAAGTGVYLFTLPITALDDVSYGQSSNSNPGNGCAIGTWNGFDASGNGDGSGVLQLRSSTTALFRFADETQVTDAIPTTWAAVDRIHASFGYWSAT